MFGKITCRETHLDSEEDTDVGFYLRKETDPPLLLLAPLHPCAVFQSLWNKSSGDARTPTSAQGRAQRAKEELRAVFCRQPGRSE